MCILAIVAMATTSTALAQDRSATVNELRRWGMIGTWANQCPVEGERTFRATYEIEVDGRPVSRSRLPDGTDNTIEIVSAKVTDQGRLAIETRNPKEPNPSEPIRTLVLEKTGPKSIRAILSRTGVANYSIKDGRFTQSGQDTPSLSRCD